MNFFINYYLNVSLIGSTTKNDRCQDVTNGFPKFTVKNHPISYRIFYKQYNKNNNSYYCLIKDMDLRSHGELIMRTLFADFTLQAEKKIDAVMSENVIYFSTVFCLFVCFESVL